MNEKIEEVKGHLRRSKKKYFIGAAEIVVGAVGMAALRQPAASATQKVCGMFILVALVLYIFWKRT